MTHFVDRDSAAHEIGHALVARELGATGVRAVMPGAHGRGYCELRMPSTRDELQGLLDELVVLVAGCAAEHMSAGIDPLGPYRGGEIALRTLMIETQPSPNAYEYALDVLERIVGDRAHARAVLSRCSDELLSCAVEILQKHLPEFERLAYRLQTKGAISI